MTGPEGRQANATMPSAKYLPPAAPGGSLQCPSPAPVFRSLLQLADWANAHLGMFLDFVSEPTKDSGPDPPLLPSLILVDQVQSAAPDLLPRIIDYNRRVARARSPAPS